MSEQIGEASRDQPQQPPLTTVTVRTNGEKKEVPVTDGMTAGDALKVAEMKTGWRSKLFVNGEAAESTTSVNPGDTITVSPRIKNG